MSIADLGHAPKIENTVGQLVYRTLFETDRERLSAHFLRLDADDRRSRFFGQLGDAAILDYVGRIDWRRTTILGCVLDGQVRGVVELVVSTATVPASAELAFSVERAFQNRDIGTALLEKALDLARNRFIGRVTMLCLRDNARMVQLAQKHSAQLQVQEGEIQGRIWPLWPTCRSLLEELSANGQAVLAALFETGAAERREEATSARPMVIPR